MPSEIEEDRLPSRAVLEEMGFGDMLELSPPTPGAPLTLIVEWYRALPPRARQGLSLANLHDLSKALTKRDTVALQSSEASRARVEEALAKATAELSAGLVGRTHDVWQRAYNAGSKAVISDIRAALNPPTEEGR